MPLKRKYSTRNEKPENTWMRGTKTKNTETIGDQRKLEHVKKKRQTELIRFVKRTVDAPRETPHTRHPEGKGKRL